MEQIPVIFWMKLQKSALVINAESAAGIFPWMKRSGLKTVLFSENRIYKSDIKGIV